MSQAHIARSDPSADHHGHASMDTQRQVSHFWRHFLEMLGSMVAGMIVTGAVFVSVVGLRTWDEITHVYPTQALLAMAFGMTVPMVAWMLYRGNGLEELLRDGAGDGPTRDPVPVSRLVQRHQQCPVRGILSPYGLRDAQSDALPEERVLDADVRDVVWTSLFADSRSKALSHPIAPAVSQLLTNC